MMHYILLVNYPAEARKKIRGFTKGRDLVNEEVRKLGGKITRYFTQGPYDAVVHLEVPSEKEAMRLVVYVGSLAALRPAFQADGTITAANASQISDGAAALVLADADAADAAGLQVLATIRGYGQIGGSDATLHDRPAEALRVALKRAGMSPGDLDLVEINEAFAAVALWSARSLDIDPTRVNLHGGAVALGHPLGATGARIVVTLINALRARGGGVGGATLCGGGGQGDAIVIEVAG